MRTPEVIAKQHMNKGVLLYCGYNSNYNTKYTIPNDDQLRQILDSTDEVLLIPITTYNRYTDENGVEKVALTREDIENMPVEWVGDPNRYEIIKGEYFATAEPKFAANYHVQDYVDIAADIARRMVAIKPNVRLWFSVPLAECLHALTHLFAESYVSCVHAIKRTVEPEIWENNVQGIYYTGEDIVTSGYTKFDPTLPEQDFNNPIVYSMRKVSEVVHAYGKEMLWIPYYHDAAPSSRNLGYVVNLTNIFDTVIIQPSYFFNATRKDGLEIIAKSIERQAVLDPEFNVIGGEKKSNALIGFEMEIDSQFFNDESYVPRYYAYEEAFGKFVGKYPTAYYAGYPETLIRVGDIIKKFFNK